jgi:hypothetical protein
MLLNELLVMGVQQMEEFFSLLMYEISFIITHDGFGAKYIQYETISAEKVWGSCIY